MKNAPRRGPAVLYIFVVLAVAAAVSAYQIHTMPGRLQAERNAFFAEQAGGTNRFFHSPPADASWNAFVRPCPDLLYSYAAFDLRRAPLAIELPGHNDYWVLQMVADDTASFAYVGDRTEGSRPANLLLTSDDTPPCSPPDGFKQFRSPSPTGTLLLRYLIRSPESLGLLENLRASIRIGPLECGPQPGRPGP